MATVQGNFVQIQQPNLHGPLPLLLWKTTIVVPTGQTGVQVQPSNKVSGRVIECRIDPVTLAAGATIKGFATSDGFAAKNYFMDYTVPNPAVETKDALYQRLLVHGTIQIDVASAVAGNSFVLYVYVHPSADVLTVQGDADELPDTVAGPLSLGPNATEPDQALTVDATAGGVQFAAFHADTTHVEFDIQTADVRVTFDGSAPTSSNGHLLPVGYSDTWSKAKASAAKFIRTGATSAVVHASQLKGA